MPIDPQIALSGQTPLTPSVGTQVTNALQLRNMLEQGKLIPEQLKSAQLENQVRQTQLAGQQAQNEAYSKAVTVDPATGIPTVDKGVITSTLAAKGQGHLIPDVLKQFTEMEKSAGEVADQKSKLAASEADYAGTVGAAAKAAGYDPDILKAGLTHAASIYGPQSPSAQALNSLYQNPAMVQAMADHLIAG